MASSDSYTVTAPVVVYRTPAGRRRYVYADQPLPVDQLADGELDRLKALNMVARPKDVPAPVAPDADRKRTGSASAAAAADKAADGSKG